MKEIDIEKTKSGYYFVTVGKEGHGRYSAKIWVSGSLAAKLFDEELGRPVLDLPLQGVDITKTVKDSLVLHEGTKNLFYIHVPCGYRGGSSFEIVEPKEPEMVIEFETYRSPNGSLGVGSGALVLTSTDNIIYRWSRSGRLYGDEPEGKTQITVDGEIIDLPEDDVEELLK